MTEIPGHLSPAEFRHLLEREHSELQTRLLFHHLSVCPDCYRAAGYLLDLYRSGAIGLQFSVMDVDLACSRAASEDLWAELQKFPAEKRRELVLHQPFSSWGLCELLCRESDAAAAGDPYGALELATLAIFIADAIEEWEPAEIHWLCELRALAWAHAGNALRVLGRLNDAESAFLESDRWWEEGASDVGDILGYEAQILDLRVSLRRAQRRFPEALEISEKAFAAATSALMRGTILLNRAKILEEVDDVAGAVAALRSAEPMIDSTNPSRLHLCVQHNLFALLTRTGEYKEAERLLPQVTALAEKYGSELDQFRLRWTTARLSAGLGRVNEGIALLETVRQAFAARRLLLDAALAGLELATLYLEGKRFDRIQELLVETYLLFESQDVKREALGAVTLLREATGAQQLTAELILRTAISLKDSLRDA